MFNKKMKTLILILFTLGFSVFGYAQSPREIYYDYDANDNIFMRFVVNLRMDQNGGDPSQNIQNPSPPQQLPNHKRTSTNINDIIGRCVF